MRWFGPSWGAPVCDPRYSSATPLEEFCLECDQLITEGDRGLIVACGSPGLDSAFWWWFGEDEHWVCAYHIDCFEQVTLGDVKTKRRRD